MSRHKRQIDTSYGRTRRRGSARSRTKPDASQGAGAPLAAQFRSSSFVVVGCHRLTDRRRVRPRPEVVDGTGEVPHGQTPRYGATWGLTPSNGGTNVGAGTYAAQADSSSPASACWDHSGESGRPIMATRPAWVNDELFPFKSHFTDVSGAQVHYIDEGSGPVFLALHGNPTWSFLYRHIVHGLKDRFRCVALDYPGFGLSTAPAGYSYTVAEHARVVEGFVEQLRLRDITLMVQDWGGPIGFWVATRHPESFRAFVIGNTWAWPMTSDRSAAWFSRILGSARVGGALVRRADIFTNVFMRGGIRRKRLSVDEWFMYKRPHPTAESRVPVHVMPREILAADSLLAAVEQGLARVADKPALLVWGDKDMAFREPHRLRWEQTFPNHRTTILRGASHYIQEDAPEEIVAAIRDWSPVETATE